eukprot:TRINITY_DN630_c0_g1_i1.p1 TRINITY_DN630_c0_g1~~TRINITY_DN630_c0_g1_i1.p1  ORF type:complete len:645 (-),score=58.51 TRINITY_DN630_c0_g1_i1:98-1780(-)
MVDDAHGTFDKTKKNYWVHDPTDTPTGPEHGWVHIQNTWKPNVHTFEKGETGHGIECSDSGTTVRLGTQHVDEKKIGPGSVLFIEGCATEGEAQSRDRFVDLAQVLHHDASKTTFSAHPKSLAELGHLLEKQKIVFHVPLPGNKAVSSVEDAFAEFQSSGLLENRQNIHRIKATSYDPLKETFALPAQDSAWKREWSYENAFETGFSMEGDQVKASASISGSYKVSAAIATTLVGQIVYKKETNKVEGFLAYLAGDLNTNASAKLGMKINGKFKIDLMPNGMHLKIPIFQSIVGVSVQMGWDLDLVVELNGKAEAEIVSEGKGNVNIGAYYNTAMPGQSKPIHTGKFEIQPRPLEATAELAGKAALVLDVMFGVEVNVVGGLAATGVSVGLTIEPGVFLQIDKCPKENEFSQILTLEVRCGAVVKSTWSLLWSSLVMTPSVLYESGMSTCTTVCRGACKRTLAETACPEKVPGWGAYFMSYITAGQEAFGKLVNKFKEIAVEVFCDELTAEALAWDGKDFSHTPATTMYKCSREQIPKELKEIKGSDFVFYQMVIREPAR